MADLRLGAAEQALRMLQNGYTEAQEALKRRFDDAKAAIDILAAAADKEIGKMLIRTLEGAAVAKIAQLEVSENDFIHPGRYVRVIIDGREVPFYGGVGLQSRLEPGKYHVILIIDKA